MLPQRNFERSTLEGYNRWLCNDLVGLHRGGASWRGVRGWRLNFSRATTSQTPPAPAITHVDRHCTVPYVTSAYRFSISSPTTPCAHFSLRIAHSPGYYTECANIQICMCATPTRISLLDHERSALQELLSFGALSERERTRALVLLSLDQQLSTDTIAHSQRVSKTTVRRLRTYYSRRPLGHICPTYRGSRHSLAFALSPSRARNTIILCGAGVSRPSPSNLPTAYTLMKEYLDCTVNHLGSSTTAYSAVGRLAREAFRHILNAVRFEVFFSYVAASVDPSLRVLRQSLGGTQFNALHAFLASHLQHGGQVWTTNFDNLIELAHASLFGRRPPVVIDYATATPPADAPGLLHKLHGSLDLEDSRYPIAATIDSIARQCYFSSDHSDRFDARKAALQGKTLVVLGYSGYDDFDIMPLLNDSSPAELVWINHEPQSRSQERADERRIRRRLANHRPCIVHAVTLELINAAVPDALSWCADYELVAPRTTIVASIVRDSVASSSMCDIAIFLTRLLVAANCGEKVLATWLPLLSLTPSDKIVALAELMINGHIRAGQALRVLVLYFNYLSTLPLCTSDRQRIELLLAKALIPTSFVKHSQRMLTELSACAEEERTKDEARFALATFFDTQMVGGYDRTATLLRHGDFALYCLYSYNWVVAALNRRFGSEDINAAERASELETIEDVLKTAVYLTEMLDLKDLHRLLQGTDIAYAIRANAMGRRAIARKAIHYLRQGAHPTTVKIYSECLSYCAGHGALSETFARNVIGQLVKYVRVSGANTAAAANMLVTCYIYLARRNSEKYGLAFLERNLGELMTAARYVPKAIASLRMLTSNIRNGRVSLPLSDTDMQLLRDVTQITTEFIGKSAVELFGVLRDLSPQDSVRRCLHVAAQELGASIDRCIQQLERAESLKLRDQNDEAIQVLQTLPDDVVAVQEERADNWLTRGDYRRAAFHAERALAVDSGSYTSLYILGFVAMQEGRWSDSIDYYKRSLEWLGHNAEIVRCLVYSLIMSGQTDEAVECLKERMYDPELSRNELFMEDLEGMIARGSAGELPLDVKKMESLYAAIFVGDSTANLTRYDCMIGARRYFGPVAR